MHRLLTSNPYMNANIQDVRYVHYTEDFCVSKRILQKSVSEWTS